MLTAPTNNTTTGNSTLTQTKNHVAKPELFNDVEQFDKFKRQVFLYIAANYNDFLELNSTSALSSEKRILFCLSYMDKGAPGRFAQNFVEGIMDQTPPQLRILQ